jgi:hypothetical protein
MAEQTYRKVSRLVIHGDVWRSRVASRRFSVMHVCGHHNPPHVTGYWWRGESLDPALHDSIPLPRFLASMDLIEREDFDG